MKLEVQKRYKKNPFLGEMVMSVRNKQVRVRPMGADADVSIVQHNTGETFGTQLITWKKVDDEEFVKLFARNLALIFDLSAAGNKALCVLIWAVQYKAIEKDRVALNKYTLEDFLEIHKNPPLKLGRVTFARGLAELVKTRIIAKAERAGDYFINPNFVFNGDRIAFTSMIERKRVEDDSAQLDLPFEEDNNEN